MLTYIGKGDFLTGIPARDLTKEEVELYGGEERLIATGLYAATEAKPSPVTPLLKAEGKKKFKKESEA